MLNVQFHSDANISLHLGVIIIDIFISHAVVTQLEIINI